MLSLRLVRNACEWGKLPGDRRALRGGEQLVRKGREIRRADSMPAGAGGAAVESKPSLIIASIHREEGVTGVHTDI